MREPSKRTWPRFAEPELASAAAVWRSTLAGAALARREYHALDPRLETAALIILAPALVALTALILLALLVVFVIWLAIVGALFTATVFADIARRSWRARLIGTVDRRALGYPAV